MFKNLARKSRVFSLPEVEARTEHVPYTQVLKTTSANHHRRNWGIKYNLPKKAETVLVTQQGLDSNISMPQVEYGGRHARRVEKFAETGAAVRPYKSHHEFSSMFYAGQKPGKTISDMSKLQRKRLFEEASSRRYEYVKHSASLRAEGDPSPAPVFERGVAERFCGLESNAAYKNEPRKTPSTSIGLSYALKGTVYNTKNGLVSSHVIPGRVLPVGSVSRRGPFAAAGFVGSNSSSSAPSTKSTDDRAKRADGKPEDPTIIAQQRVIPMHVDQAEANENGAILVKFGYLSNASNKNVYKS